MESQPFLQVAVVPFTREWYEKPRFRSLGTRYACYYWYVASLPFQLVEQGNRYVYTNELTHTPVNSIQIHPYLY